MTPPSARGTAATARNTATFTPSESAHIKPEAKSLCGFTDLSCVATVAHMACLITE